MSLTYFQAFYFRALYPGSFGIFILFKRLDYPGFQFLRFFILEIYHETGENLCEGIYCKLIKDKIFYPKPYFFV